MNKLQTVGNSFIFFFTALYMINITIHVTVLYDLRDYLSNPYLSKAFKYVLLAVVLELVMPIMSLIILTFTGKISQEGEFRLPLGFIIGISIVMLVSAIFSAIAAVNVAFSNMDREDFRLIIVTIVLAFFAALALIGYDVVGIYLAKETTDEV